jgi:hypothetical protein
MMTHTCNSRAQEVEARGLQVQGQPWLHSETLSQKNKRKEKSQMNISSQIESSQGMKKHLPRKDVEMVGEYMKR